MLSRRHHITPAMRRAIGVLLAAVVMVTGTGCVTPDMMPYNSGYWANRGGTYWAGNRCTQQLTEVAVYIRPPGSRGDEPLDPKDAVWHAIVIKDPVAEFALFSHTQPGVTVVTDTGARPVSQWISVNLRDDRGRWRPFRAVLDMLDEGLVGTDKGHMTWDQFMALPKRTFGCW